MSMGNTRKLGPVPKGWLHCPPNGKKLIAAKFMPLKTPLSQEFDNKVPSELRYPPTELFYLASRNNVKLSLWIDLTNTDRYYCREEVERERCKYVKLRLKGHGETPSREKTQLFISLVHNHIIKHPFDCIAVHCTHGFNRTGFLITSFLVERLHYNVKTALEIFAESRAPGIYRENYIKELFRRYGNATEALPTPVLPKWCEEKEGGRRKRRLVE